MKGGGGRQSVCQDAEPEEERNASAQLLLLRVMGRSFSREGDYP